MQMFYITYSIIALIIKIDMYVFFLITKMITNFYKASKYIFPLFA